VPQQDSRAQVRSFQTLRAATLARLRRVNEALFAWDEYGAAAAMPADLHPQVGPPTLSRAALKELQRMLVEVIVIVQARLETGGCKPGSDAVYPGPWN
jgi:hypothetical protein